eukprot:scaffold267049_cov15-Prasinocladus_malaysianus.AAC.1
MAILAVLWHALLQPKKLAATQSSTFLLYAQSLEAGGPSLQLGQALEASIVFYTAANFSEFDGDSFEYTVTNDLGESTNAE